MGIKDKELEEEILDVTRNLKRKIDEIGSSRLRHKLLGLVSDIQNSLQSALKKLRDEYNNK